MKLSTLSLKKQTACLVLSILSTPLLLATERFWDGEAGQASSDYSWTTGTNWVGDVAPANSDFTDLATITGTYVGNQTINVNGSRSIRTVTFDNTAGWSVTGSQLTLRAIISSGAGTNTMNNVKTYNGTNTSWSITTGNTLSVNSLYVDSTRNLTLNGGGTVYLNSQANGFSTSRSITLSAITLQVNASSVFTDSSKTYLDDESSVLQLMTSAANLESMVGTSIINNTAFTFGATDIGGGWAQLAVVPEPAFYAIFFGISMLGLAAWRRSR